MKAHLKTLDRAHIHAPLLREFLHKNLTKASIDAINEKIKELNNHIQILSEMQEQIINKENK